MDILGPGGRIFPYKYETKKGIKFVYLLPTVTVRGMYPCLFKHESGASITLCWYSFRKTVTCYVLRPIHTEQ